MQTRAHVSLTGAILWGLSIVGGLVFAFPAWAAPPNIVLILADDLGFSDTAPYGSEIATPAISALAAEGVQFTNYHTAASCAPTRGMLLTGVDSHRNGVPNIVEAISPEQAEHANYAGTLSHDVVTVATLLQEAGYHTYMAGKWHLGKTPDLLPSRRGFERTLTMADTGADNWEQRPYIPIYEKANWFADGREYTLPEDFYSSKFFVDKSIEFIESNRADNAPFFAYIPFQAVHIPVQAPKEFTARHLGRYDAGWTALRQQRLEALTAMGILPPGTQMAAVSTTEDWDALSAEEKRYASKEMAVYAGMIEAMDHHIGRLVAYLKDAGEFEDTVFIFTSDNGSEGSEVVGKNPFVDYLQRRNGYNMDYETLGERGSFMHIGPSFASAAAAPLAYYKFFAREGGMRVPLLVSGPGIAKRGARTDAFAWVTDLAPTLLELAGVARPAGRFAGRDIEKMHGASLLPLLAGEAVRVHAPSEPIGYELGGNAALFQGDYKIVRDRAPFGDDTWRLYDIVRDPGEARPLEAAEPERFARMRALYAAYAEANGVLPVADDYDQRREVMLWGLRRRLGGPLRLATTVVAVVVLLLIWMRLRARRQNTVVRA